MGATFCLSKWVRKRKGESGRERKRKTESDSENKGSKEESARAREKGVASEECGSEKGKERKKKENDSVGVKDLPLLLTQKP